ncbi:hypothetical protein [Streptomyces sp. NPDC047985]|uniref:hypothetical protein n=1 Tax=unclassified Streptomyces TaxID=2593676 RepID=UPI00344162DB
MTQSGQGDERQLPAVRPAHEGVVLPAGGGEPWMPGGPGEQGVPAGGQPWGQPWGPQAAHPDASPLPQQAAPGQEPYAQAPQGQTYGQVPQGQPYGQPLPPAQQQPPQHHQHHESPQIPQQPQSPQSYAQPLPPEAVPGAAPHAGGDADATRYIAPVPGGPAPESPAAATQFLAHGAQPQQPYQQQQQPQAHGGDADATQYIPPVPGGAPYGIRPGAPGDRQPPAEFDNLFREGGTAGATQHMPRIAPEQQHRGGGVHQAPPAPRPGYQQADERTQGRAAPRKKRAHVTLIAAVVAGCAVVGLGAGALLSGGDSKGDDDKQPVASAGSPSKESSPQPVEDPVKTQAEALDKLLADSNNSRSAVIGAVEKTKNCQDLDQAVTDLKEAARQRRDLVTRLQGLSVDKLPDHERLTAALTKAWQASASADDHYAAWAEQAKQGKKVCKHGKARTTSQTQQATVRSGEASQAKQEASGLWNTIASKYGLTPREAVDL